MHIIQWWCIFFSGISHILGESVVNTRRRWTDPMKSADHRRNQVTIVNNNLWPPWPFNTLKENGSMNGKKKTMTLPIMKTKTMLLWSYLRERAKIGTLQLQQGSLLVHTRRFSIFFPIIHLLVALIHTKVAHDFSYHLPSAAPSLFLLAFLPQKNMVGATSISSIRLMAWDFTRKLALINMGIVFMCWGEYGIRRKIRLTPLHLESYSSPFDEAILPPFLPESDESHEINMERSPYLIDSLWNKVAKWMHHDPQALEEQRQKIIHELLALQRLKQYHHGKITKPSLDYDKKDMGYALVTGASRGIGRALAVELARWGIPLILVARSQDKLSILARELEACYGIRCHTLPADLSESDAAYMIHNTTTKAGLRVDFLINNAGVCTRGELVDTSTNDINRLVQINIGTVTTLSQLYGRDMKERRKGRILFVSSIAAGAPSTPEVAVYAASKAYEKSLSMALSMELARYGVGVTCLMPGAVKGTSFASSSQIEDAICWKVPGYAMKAPDVASVGVRALLNGAVEVAPGWHNFSFLKFIVPTLPQRLSSTLASIAFRPPSTKQRQNIDDSITIQVIETPNHAPNMVDEAS